MTARSCSCPSWEDMLIVVSRSIWVNGCSTMVRILSLLSCKRGTELTFFAAFDVVGELTFKKKLGFLDRGGDVDGMMEAIEGMLVYASQCGQVPEAHPFLLGNPLFPRA